MAQEDSIGGIMKAHIAQSGKHAGSYVRCHALKHCRVSPADDHADFAGRAEMMACNDVAGKAPEFSDNSFVGDLLNERCPGYDRWHADDGNFISIVGMRMTGISSPIRRRAARWPRRESS